MPKGGVKGNSGGKAGRSGRRSTKDELGLIALLNECWTPAQRRATIKKLVTISRSSQYNNALKATELLMAYAYGKPKQTVDLDVYSDDLREQCRELGLDLKDVIAEAKQILKESID